MTHRLSADDAWSNNDGASCDDGEFCNGADSCSGGVCTPSNENPCPDDVFFCNGEEICDEEGDTCLHSGDPCPSDDLFCTGEEFCNETADQCGTTGFPCTGDDQCLEDEDQCCLPDVVASELFCTDDGDVGAYDTCEHLLIVDDCLPAEEHGACEDATCGCAPGFFGEDCSQCTVYVNGNLDDYSAANGTSWEVALEHVQQGLNAAAPHGCEVWVARGTYYPTEFPDVGDPEDDREKTIQLKSGVALYGGFIGNETSLDQRNIKENETILSGDLDGDNTLAGNAFHVVLAEGESLISGFTLTLGNAFGEGNLAGIRHYSGGGMYINSGSPIVADCIFSFNSAYEMGGGLYSSSGSQMVTDCIFRSNSAQLYGGGLYSSSGTPMVVDCIFSSNSAQYNGGGMLVDSNSPTIRDCLFEFNSADIGGGLASWFAETTVTGCVFNSNTAEYTGGGIGTPMGGTQKLTMTDSVFISNSVESGTGAADIETSDPSSITNCIFLNNSQYLGSILLGGDQPPSLTNCTVIGRMNEWGSAIHIYSPFVSVTNSIVRGRIKFYEGDDPIVTYSAVQGGFPGEGNIADDPLFEADSVYLTPDSPCIDSGSNDVVPAEVTTDLDGNERIVDGNNDGEPTVDMGAYEFQPE